MSPESGSDAAEWEPLSCTDWSRKPLGFPTYPLFPASRLLHLVQDPANELIDIQLLYFVHYPYYTTYMDRKQWIPDVTEAINGKCGSKQQQKVEAKATSGQQAMLSVRSTVCRL